MLYVKTRRLSHSSAHVTIFLTDNANVCCNSRAWTNNGKMKQYIFDCAHFIDYFANVLVFMMLVNIV